MKNMPVENVKASNTILDEIVSHKRAELEQRRRQVPLEHLACKVQPRSADRSARFCRALTADDRVKLIAEVKPRSPSAGQLSQGLSVEQLTDVYSHYASAISVLADEKYFGGSMELVGRVASTGKLPVLCKEFIIDRYQIYEASLQGACACLLIVKILNDEALHELLSCCNELGLEPVVEVQTVEETERALTAGAQTVLINNRDLSSFKIDLGTTVRLAPLLPASVRLISASGIEARKDVELLLPYTNKFLIGSALMKAENVEAKMQELLGQC